MIDIPKLTTTTTLTLKLPTELYRRLSQLASRPGASFSGCPDVLAALMIEHCIHDWELAARTKRLAQPQP